MSRYHLNLLISYLGLPDYVKLCLTFLVVTNKITFAGFPKTT